MQVVVSSREPLSKNVFERRMSTGSGLFAFLVSCLGQILGYIFNVRLKKRSDIYLVALRHIKGEKASLPVDVRYL